jgi:hypothetical protein
MIKTISENIAPRVVGVGLALIAIAIIETTAPHHRRDIAKPPWHPQRVSPTPSHQRSSKSPRPHRPAQRNGHYDPDQRYAPDQSDPVPVVFHPRGPTTKRPTIPSHQPTTRPTSPPARPVRCTIGAKVLTISACLRL